MFVNIPSSADIFSSEELTHIIKYFETGDISELTFVVEKNIEEIENNQEIEKHEILKELINKHYQNEKEESKYEITQLEYFLSL